MPVKLVSAHRTGGHGDTGDHAAAHVGDEGNQTASIVPNTPANTIHALFLYIRRHGELILALWKNMARSRVILVPTWAFLGGFVFGATK